MMNFNEYKPTTQKPAFCSDLMVNISCIAFLVAVAAIMFFAMKLACWLDYCNIMGM